MVCNLYNAVWNDEPVSLLLPGKSSSDELQQLQYCNGPILASSRKKLLSQKLRPNFVTDRS